MAGVHITSREPFSHSRAATPSRRNRAYASTMAPRRGLLIVSMRRDGVIQVNVYMMGAPFIALAGAGITLRRRCDDSTMPPACPDGQLVIPIAFPAAIARPAACRAPPRHLGRRSHVNRLPFDAARYALPIERCALNDTPRGQSAAGGGDSGTFTLLPLPTRGPPHPIPLSHNHTPSDSQRKLEKTWILVWPDYAGIIPPGFGRARRSDQPAGA